MSEQPQGAAVLQDGLGSDNRKLKSSFETCNHICSVSCIFTLTLDMNRQSQELHIDTSPPFINNKYGLIMPGGGPGGAGGGTGGANCECRLGV